MQRAKSTNDLIAEAIDATGQPGFAPALAALCQAVSGYDSTFISAFFAEHRPVQLFENLNREFNRVTIQPYLDFAYLLDPFHVLFRSGVGDSVVTLAECAPDDFRDSEYFRTFYEGTGLYHETSVIVAAGSAAAISISLGSRNRGFALSEQNIETLKAMLPIIRALCHRHWTRVDPGTISDKGQIGHHLEGAFERFGSSVLRPREAEILRLILKGHSSKSVARVLGNSPETIRVHRKHIYSKLDVASQGDLFAVFLEALSRTPPNSTDDPLVYLKRG